ncbi:hypothetical protein L2E82_22534 [Cichorium intybus]|uniref:Uncharacterized protein n=1 Tax=Cichorium intybus TaxID=13427 RepID=A0ACB9DXL9_CICIN|nr:hypothetical protein L2E82_22534 [Cichorium intybus]
MDHKPENYEDLQLEFSPLLFSSMERYLPPNLLNAPRETKYSYMRDILRRYSTSGERSRVKKHSEYRHKIISNYQVENLEKWILETKLSTMRPNTMNKYGVVLDDFGMESMLENLMEDFIHHISKIFFGDVGGFALDSHHGFVVEYGFGRDVELGFHEIFEYSHVPGHAVIHRGRHRHGARTTTAGNRVNLRIWCRSSVFREIRKQMKEFASWCGDWRVSTGEERKASSGLMINVVRILQEFLR